MKVMLSLGYGRLHLMSSARFIAAAGCKIRMICGWVPRNPNGLLVRACSKLIGRDLSAGMKKRVIDIPGVEVCSMPLVDFFDQALRLVDRKLFKGKHKKGISSFSWRVFGWWSRRNLNGADVFHVRSGAGQGGAIRKAKALGMKVVCDHSIAHPAFMDTHLRVEYEKNGAMFDLGMDSPFWQQIVKDCEEADVVMVNSFFVKDTFVENGFAPEKIKVVYLGQREDFFGLRQRRFDVSGLMFDAGGGANSNLKPQTSNLKLLFTGGFGFRKGGEYILEALKILKQRGVAFEMDVVGDYSSAGQLISRYEAELDISYASTIEPRASNFKLTFHGPKAQDELKSFLANGDIYVFPSLAEGCAQSGMEAMAAGMCVVATHESGFPIMDGEDGYLVPSKDAKAIADRIMWLMDHPNEIDRVGANAAKLIRQNYTWERYAETVKRMYEELLTK
jgi:glycosyltransferase involved in cell wall biosynthesis